jgi:hypothetical protein
MDPAPKPQWQLRADAWQDQAMAGLQELHAGLTPEQFARVAQCLEAVAASYRARTEVEVEKTLYLFAEQLFGPEPPPNKGKRPPRPE